MRHVRHVRDVRGVRGVRVRAVECGEGALLVAQRFPGARLLLSLESLALPLFFFPLLTLPLPLSAKEYKITTSSHGIQSSMIPINYLLLIL